GFFSAIFLRPLTYTPSGATVMTALGLTVPAQTDWPVDRSRTSTLPPGATMAEIVGTPSFSWASFDVFFGEFCTGLIEPPVTGPESLFLQPAASPAASTAASTIFEVENAMSVPSWLSCVRPIDQAGGFTLPVPSAPAG